MSSILALVLDDGYTSADTADQLALAVVTVYHACAYCHDHPKQVRDLRQNGAKRKQSSTTQPSSRQQDTVMCFAPTNTFPASS